MKASLQQIETFYWVVRLGGFHAAARHLHLTQPAISTRIQELEDILGIKLFERGGYRAQVTPLGRDVFAQAEKLLRLAEEFERAGKRDDPMRGLLRLGANESTAMTGLTELLGRLKAAYPALRVELTIDVGAALSRKLNARELDMAILSDPVPAPHVVDHAVGSVDLRWLASPQLPLPKRELAPADLAALPLLLMPASSTLHEVALEWLRCGKAEPESFSTCNSLSLLIQLAAAGHGATLLPYAIAAGEVKRGTLQLLPVRPAIPPHPYFISHLRQDRAFADGAIVRMAREALLQSGLLMRAPGATPARPST
jgi:DNA-binding transcriptional LysR family regulator